MEMSSMIDLPLDDIIKLNKSSRKRPRHLESVTAAPRFVGSSAPVRPANYFPPPTARYPYPGPPMVPGKQLPTTLCGGDSGEGTRLDVSNLDDDVSNEDIKLLFSDVGALKRYGIHCDRSGRSMGTAEVVFFRPEDTIAAVRRYNNARLDGKPLKIEPVGTNLVARNYYYVEPYRATGAQRLVITTQGQNCNTGCGRPLGGSGWRRSENVKPTTEALDADLERHRLKAMRASKRAEGS